MLTHSWDGFSALHTLLYLVIFCLGVLVVSKHSSRSLPTTAVINWYFVPAPSWLFRHLQTSTTTARPSHGQEWYFYPTHFPQLYRSQQKQVLVFIFGVQGARRCGWQIACVNTEKIHKAHKDKVTKHSFCCYLDCSTCTFCTDLQINPRQIFLSLSCSTAPTKYTVILE